MPISIDTKTLVQRTEKHELRLTGKDIIGLLRDAHPNLPIPDRVDMVYVSVPGGGDWSNTDLDIDDRPVIIEWTIKSTEGNLN